MVCEDTMYINLFLWFVGVRVWQLDNSLSILWSSREKAKTTTPTNTEFDVHSVPPTIPDCIATIQRFNTYSSKWCLRKPYLTVLLSCKVSNPIDRKIEKSLKVTTWHKHGLILVTNNNKNLLTKIIMFLVWVSVTSETFSQILCFFYIL